MSKRSTPDARRDALRIKVTAVEADIDGLSSPTGSTPSGIAGLQSSWGALVEQLDLGSAPELRSCPKCNQLGMAAATRCGYCWERLTPRSRADVAEAV